MWRGNFARTLGSGYPPTANLPHRLPVVVQTQAPRAHLALVQQASQGVSAQILQMVLLDSDAFLTHLTRILEKSRGTGTVQITMKRCAPAHLHTVTLTSC